MAILVQVNGVPGVTVPVEAPVFRIGRGEDNQLRIDDELASRVHAVIEFKKGAEDASGDWILRDHNSTNGTFVNDRRITVHALVDGDVLRIGKTFFRFFADDHAELGETRVIKKTFIPGVYYTTEKD
ncbi:MAG: FHA domain-containing protein [Gammaproteobacteria bacterium]|nr:FHA domain-containing protein [Gammaproteobacteria bacterium]